MPDSASLVGAIDDAGRSTVYRIDAATGTPTALTASQSVRAIALSRDGRTAVALRDGFSEPPTLVRLDLSGGPPAKISTFNDAVLANVDWGRYESVTYKGSGGADIQMWVVYPPGFDKTKKYPSTCCCTAARTTACRTHSRSAGTPRCSPAGAT